jgi:hypothetical protein
MKHKTFLHAIIFGRERGNKQLGAQCICSILANEPDMICVLAYLLHVAMCLVKLSSYQLCMTHLTNYLRHEAASYFFRDEIFCCCLRKRERLRENFKIWFDFKNNETFWKFKKCLIIILIFYHHFPTIKFFIYFSPPC